MCCGEQIERTTNTTKSYTYMRSTTSASILRFAISTHYPGEVGQRRSRKAQDCRKALWDMVKVPHQVPIGPAVEFLPKCKCACAEAAAKVSIWYLKQRPYRAHVPMGALPHC